MRLHVILLPHKPIRSSPSRLAQTALKGKSSTYSYLTDNTM